MRQKFLPFYDERKADIDMIVLHCTVHTPENIVEAFCQHRVSSHYVIGGDGAIWQMVADDKRAWHAGVSYWRGVRDINSHSVGIELSSPDLGQSDYTTAQKQSLTELLQKLIKQYAIAPQNIVGHSDIAPTRKADPGRSFFWRELAAAGIGIWPDNSPLSLAEKSDFNEADTLALIGYDTADIKAARLAFCRRFLPESVDDDADIGNIENHLRAKIEAFAAPQNYHSRLKVVAQQYLMASNTPCKI
ncbi:MAG: N-acetylmuramoyl-L-alanine amidase [Alphaproteobacteria bacterium]|nr:N-acetylmuramoyl-L-alanine amidase [Alphaproteobacteria bacterium]